MEVVGKPELDEAARHGGRGAPELGEERWSTLCTRFFYNRPRRKKIYF
jgi:hypothetical protein